MYNIIEAEKNIVTVLLYFITERTVSVTVPSDDYLDIIKPDSMITAYMKGTVKETGRSYAHIDNISVLKPSLMISVSLYINRNISVQFLGVY